MCENTEVQWLLLLVSETPSLVEHLLNLVTAIAFYQADSVAEIYSTLGYLVAIISVIAVPIMPRAKFFQTLILNVFGICIGSVSLPKYKCVAG
jgi:hypothetical protein